MHNGLSLLAIINNANNRTCNNNISNTEVIKMAEMEIYAPEEDIDEVNENDHA